MTTTDEQGQSFATKTLEHFGVKGMKWGVRKDRGHEGERVKTKKLKKLDKKYEREHSGVKGFIKVNNTFADKVNPMFAELSAKPEDGLYDASGVANVEAVNKALYEQVEAAGASASTLAMLGVATGQFTQEQAEAALKAAVLQEQIKAIAAAVVAGDLGIGEALGQLGQVREALDTANLQSAITGAGGPLDETQTQLDTLTDAEHQVTLDMNIQQVIDGTTEAGRLIDTLPTTRTMTIRWEQAGADVIAALRALGIIV